MMKLKLTILLLFVTTYFANAQAGLLSPDAEISVLTIGPGASLNDAFGHNGFRIKDKNKRFDIVFNYGTFDFETPNFYLKFAQGKLNYRLASNSYLDFIEFYIAQNRTVEEQILNLTQEQKQQVFNFLLNNAKPENKFYLYDFFYDNCATKMRDVLKVAINEPINFNEPQNFEAKTFRKLIYEHVNKNSWGSFGIDIALGSVIDKEATANEHMFLPKFIHSFFNPAELTASKKPLVKESRILYKQVEKSKTNSFITSPLLIFSLLALIILVITYRDNKNTRRTKWLDTTLFTLTGLVGIVVLLLWFATDHSATANNYNLLWAFPLNLFIIGQLYKKTRATWFIKYLKFLIIILCLQTLHWVIGIQIFAIALIPLLIALVIRYLFLINYFNKSS